MKKFGIIIFLFSICVFIHAQNTEVFLNLKWEFRQKGTGKWYPASVPGTVHTDLISNKIIPDPFFGDNEKKMQWIENEDWEYKTEFTLDKKTISQNNIELKFEGLDTYAKIYVNDKLLAETDNMFRSWTINIKKNAKEGSNTLLLVFETAVKKGKAEATKLPYTLPGDEKIFTRKAQYQYGWDFGPRFVTCGIWKPIKLITWNKLKIESIYAHTKLITDSLAKVDFILELKTETDDYYEIKYNYTDRKLVQNRMQTKLVHLKPGSSTTTLTCDIPNPKLWWCNGLNDGRSSLYSAGFKITKDDSLITQNGITFGIRTIELIQDKDSIGKSFYFKLNGVAIFMKGANYIPQNNFLPSVGKDEYRKLLSKAKDANMNMLRVWGGSAYADEEFYTDCDKAGILVWQDFMFACAMYPSDKNFLENIKQEVIEQVKKLRNHPCLALWCGNNEIDEGWYNWDWQKQFHYSKKDSAKIWIDYQNLFQKILPEIVKQSDFKTAYWPSSPSIGWGHKESLQQGDSHYWGVWWGNEPFEMYEKKVGRFMSEYGFQGMPSLQTFKTFCDSSDLNLNSIAVKNHQKHPTGYQTITNYMEKDFEVPKDFEEFIYVSQLLQARGMKTAIESHRVAKPYCMGTLFWQLNDCWPATSWSAIDFYDRPKAFYYELGDLYDDVLISVKKEEKDYKIYIVNDKLKPINGTLTINFCDFSGKEFQTKKMVVKLLSNSSQFYCSFPATEDKALNHENTYLRCRFVSSDSTIIKKTLYFFTSPKNLNLQIPKLNLVFDSLINKLKIKSNTLVKNLYLNPSIISFHKNYFDLEAGEEIEVKLNSPIKNVNEIKFMSLNNINH
ncbi:MAG TPA: glycoside hydrolase family 2 protein [Bacteroidia bacterium]|nr:glycoside hydrolase family 2 protein [Bacteroidia bacterium]